MKKINLLLLMLLIAGYSFCQSLVLSNEDTVRWGAVGTLVNGKVTVKNISGLSKTVKCKRLVIHNDAGNTNYFCWGLTCYGPLTDVSPTPLVIAGGDSSMSFVGYVSDSAIAGVDTVLYTFFDVNNTADSISFMVRYYFGPAGTNELPASGNLFNASPNPAIDNSAIHYTLSNNVKAARLILTNILGSKVAEYPLDTRTDSFLLSTENLSNGVYFYSLEADGKMISTKRLFVSR